MSTQRFSNVAISPLVSNIDSSQTTLQVASAAKFPANGNFAIVVDQEIMNATFVTGNTITVQRGQEGTSATAHNAGVSVAHVLTKVGLLKSIPQLNNLRLTLQNNVPIPSSDLLNQTTIYCTQYSGNKITLFDSTTQLHQLHTLDTQSISLTIPSGLYQQYDIYIYDNGGTLALEAVAWTRMSGNVVGATNTSPITITSSGHGLSNGDVVVCDGLTGNTFANQIPAVIGNVTTNTFDLLGVPGNGTWISGGVWYKLNNQMPSLTVTNAIITKSADNTRRYLGCLLTWGSTPGQTEDSVQRRLLYNIDNQVFRRLKVIESANSWTYAVAAWRPLNNDFSNLLMLVQTGFNYSGYIDLLGILRLDGTSAGGIAVFQVSVNNYTSNLSDMFGYASIAATDLISKNARSVNPFAFYIPLEFCLTPGSISLASGSIYSGVAGFVLL